VQRSKISEQPNLHKTWQVLLFKGKARTGLMWQKKAYVVRSVRQLQVLESPSLHTAYGVRLMKIRKEFVQNLFKKWRNEGGCSYCFDCLRRSKRWKILAPKRLSVLHPHARDKAQHIKFEEKIFKLRLDSKSSFQVELRQLQADFSISTNALFPVSMLWYDTLTWPVQQQSYETPELVQCWCIVSSKSKKIR